jgi:2-methylcitrate dehydratase
MKRITVKAEPAFAKTGGNAPATRLQVTTNDGKQITREVDEMPGFPGRPMGRAEIERKFRSNVGERWPTKQADAVLQELWSLEKADNLSALIGMLAT